MMTIERFEDVRAWQMARELTKSVYLRGRCGEFSKDWGLRDQMQRAAVSIGSNIAEGFERNSDREFLNFLYIAKGSCGEVRSQLYTAFDLGYLDETQFVQLREQCLELSRTIARLIKAIKAAAAPEAPSAPSLRSKSAFGARYKG